MNVEKILTERVGEVGKKLHTARSRNDQVALDFRLYTALKIEETDLALAELQRVLVELAEEHLTTLMPGYTHLQRAQPVTLAHHLLAYFEMFRRDRDRLADVAKRVKFPRWAPAPLPGPPSPLTAKWSRRNLACRGSPATPWTLSATGILLWSSSLLWL